MKELAGDSRGLREVGFGDFEVVQGKAGEQEVAAYALFGLLADAGAKPGVL